jgi:hypothetical protein
MGMGLGGTHRLGVQRQAQDAHGARQQAQEVKKPGGSDNSAPCAWGSGSVMMCPSTRRGRLPTPLSGSLISPERHMKKAP